MDETAIEPRLSGRLIRLATVAALMFGFAVAGIELTRLTSRIALVWLANGAVLALLIRSPRREWPALGAATLAANLAANMVCGDTPGVAVVLSLCNLLEIAAMAAFLARDPNLRRLDDPQSIFRFAIAAAVAPVAPAFIAATFLSPTFDAETVGLFVEWFLADALGLMLVTPLISSWTRRRQVPVTSLALVEPIAILLAIAAASTLVFSSEQPRLFLLCPILLFAGFRLPAAWSSTAAALSAVLAIAFTIQGYGPMSRDAFTPEGQILLLQAYFAVALVLTIPVSAIIGERNRLDLALTAREQQFRLLAEASPAGIMQCAPDGTPLYVNARWVELSGVSMTQLRSRDWLCVIAPDDRPRTRALWRSALHDVTEATECLRCNFVGKDPAWADVFITPERDASGAVFGWVVRLIDATERIEAGRALAESEALYRLLAENARDIIMRMTLDGTKQFVSSASQLILGIKPEEMVGQPISAFIHPDDWAHVQSSLSALVTGEERQSVRYRKRRADGCYLWVEAVYHLVHDPLTGSPVEIIASVRDIDLRQQAELVAAAAMQKLRERNRLLTMAEELAVVGHWHFDPLTGEFALSNQTRRLAGLNLHDIITPAAALATVVPADRWLIKRTLIAAMKTHSTANCRVRIVRPNSEQRFLDLAIQSEQRSGGAYLGLFGVVHDVSRKVADERNLVDALDETRAAAESKSLFLATMSHEIRTPMTGVLGMIDLLRDNPSDHDRDNFLATLQQSATLLMAVLNDVLDYSKMEHHNVEIHNCDFDFEGLAQSTLDLFFNAASKKGLLITLAVDTGASPNVHGDPVRIQQVMSNLINNAIKFTDSGSIAVLIRARPGANGEQTWRVEVRDTGIGIGAEQIANLFDPFTQVDDGAGRRFGGTGLGLAISRRLIVAMGGTLGVESMPKGGSTFWFELGLKIAAATPAKTRPRLVANPPARALKILVAEDNPINQLLITALLRRQGHVPTCVDDGQKAVELALAEPFDCILMDMQMPVMDGITATRTIRQSAGPQADIPIIALTADASPERRRFYDNAGLTDFMTKPIDGAALAARLAEIAGQGAAAAGAAAAIDEEHLNRIRSALGPTRYGDLMSLFLTELDLRPGQLREHLLAGRLDQARAEAHSLKGAAVSIGATLLGEATLAIEQNAVADNIKINVRLIDNLDRAIAQTRAALGAPLLDTDRASYVSA